MTDNSNTLIKPIITIIAFIIVGILAICGVIWYYKYSSKQSQKLKLLEEGNNPSINQSTPSTPKNTSPVNNNKFKFF